MFVSLNIGISGIVKGMITVYNLQKQYSIGQICEFKLISYDYKYGNYILELVPKDKTRLSAKAKEFVPSNTTIPLINNINKEEYEDSKLETNNNKNEDGKENINVINNLEKLQISNKNNIMSMLESFNYTSKTEDLKNNNDNEGKIK